MRKVRILTAFIATALTVLCAVCAGAEAPEEIISDIRSRADAHKASIQSVNGVLFEMSPEELAAADFKNYDTGGERVGTELYSFAEPVGSILKRLEKGTIENELNGKGNAVVTLRRGNYDVHSIVGLGGYPELFASNTVLRAATGTRTALNRAYPANIPDYQVVKNRKNIYVENIDFYGFSSIKFEYCENIIFNNCTFNGFADNGLVFRGCKDITVLNCAFNGCGNKMNDFTNGGYSVRVIGTADYPSSNVLVEGCVMDNPCGHAVSLLDYVDDFVIRNNRITNSVWGAINYWRPSVSGNYVNVIENNECYNIGFGTPSPNDPDASSGTGCSAIFAENTLKKTVVKNNTVKNAVENGIEGAFELVYRNTVSDTGENSAARYTASTEGIYIMPTAEFEQKYIANSIDTRGIRCISLYSENDDEYAGIYIIGNRFRLRETDRSVVCKYSRSDIEINCKRLKKLVIRENTGLMTDETSVNIYIDKNYVMDYFDLENRCKIGAVPSRARYCYNINVR